ncbi:VOC family protein [Sphingoaurantiacus capsulatus]|uniref:VOC family protein n=1 Tax=Sphingoaurantiacus capsulatus TaxID=1771310 RepID=A0ABV7X836_9SPHN
MSLNDAAAMVAFINVSDRDRALGFYCDTLGLSVRSSDGYGDFLAAGPGLIRMTVLPGATAALHPVLGWNVADIGAEVRDLTARGVAFTRYDGLEQDALGIWTSPENGSKIAFFADPDGNVLTVSQA